MTFHDITRPKGTLNIYSHFKLDCNKLNKFNQSNKKSSIRETKHLSTDADSSTDAIGGWTKANSATKKKLFFALRFQTTSKQKCSNVRPLLSITFPQGFRISKNIGHPTLGGGGKKTVKKEQKPKKTKKSEEKNFFLRGDFRKFTNKNVHI